MDKIQVGDTVKSKVNTIYTGTYTVIKTNKVTCWVTPDEKQTIMKGGKQVEYSPIYKNIKYNILEKVKGE